MAWASPTVHWVDCDQTVRRLLPLQVDLLTLPRMNVCLETVAQAGDEGVGELVVPAGGVAVVLAE